jgi:hypothetical protein
MTIQPTLSVSDTSLAGPARQGEEQSLFWRRVAELLTLRRLHANSDAVLEIAMRYDIDENEKAQELERLAQKNTNQGADMLQSPTVTKLNTDTPSAAETARSGSLSLATDIHRAIMSQPQHIQMLAASHVLGELIAESVNTRQLGPVEGLLDEIESNIDFGNAMQVRQYARGLAALAEVIRCRMANL